MKGMVEIYFGPLKIQVKFLINESLEVFYWSIALQIEHFFGNNIKSKMGF